MLAHAVILAAFPGIFRKQAVPAFTAESSARLRESLSGKFRVRSVLTNQCLA